MLGTLGSEDSLALVTAIPNTQQGRDGSPFARVKNPYKLSRTSRLIFFFDGSLFQYRRYVGIRRNEVERLHPTNQCPPSPPVMVLPPPTVPMYAPLAWPSRSLACLAAPTTPAILSHQGSYRPTTSSWSPLLISLPCSRPLPPVRGGTTPPTSLTQPSEHSPCRSVTFAQ